jgi:xylulokinase
MMLLGLDCGSSSIKAAILRNDKVVGKIVRASFDTQFDGIRAEVDPADILKAVRSVVHQLGEGAKKVDAIALDVMSPSWLAMDRQGRALTPIVTHQDRRSVEVARQLEKKVGKARHLHLTGNRPFPGGISSTTWGWFVQHQPAVLKRADLVGHLSTFLHRTLTGARVTDPSNASFMGVYSTLTLKGWNEELCEAVGANRRLLPDVLDANQIGGHVTRAAARRFGLTDGTPMLVGIVDGSSALLLGGAKPGQLLNVCGSTDVLALCTDHPKPHEQLLTRAVGVGRRWVQVSTIAAAGASLTWAHREFFSDLPVSKFNRLIHQLAASPLQSPVRFEPYLAGDRTAIEQLSASFTGLNLSTNRNHLLGAIIKALAAASAARIPLLEATGTRIHHDVLLSGGLADELAKVLHRDWPGRWKFKQEDEATLRGLAKLHTPERRR